MSQPSFVNRYVNERLLYVAHASPFISMADALDLLIRISTFLFAGERCLWATPLRLQETTSIQIPRRDHEKTVRDLYLIRGYCSSSLFIIFLAGIVILACSCGIQFASSVSALESLPVRRANVHRTMLHGFALSWKLAKITLRVNLQRRGNEQARRAKSFGLIESLFSGKISSCNLIYSHTAITFQRVSFERPGRSQSSLKAMNSSRSHWGCRTCFLVLARYVSVQTFSVFFLFHGSSSHE